MKNIFISLCFLPQVVFAVYGEDNRKDFYQLQSKQVKELSKAMLYRIDKHELRGLTFRRYWTVITKKLGDKGICASESYSKQDTIRIGCSAVLIGVNKVLTGGSCISDYTCNNDLYYWTFGYHKTTKDQTFSKQQRKNFFKCKKIIKRVYNPAEGISFAIFTLKKNPKGIKPVVVSKKAVLKTDELVVMGHPVGLPLKIADKAFSADQNEDLFIANSDIRGETNGGIAFNKKTKELVGLLVYGSKNYEYSNEENCSVVVRTEDSEAQELFVKPSVFSKYL
jgi:V8-like Glu-specific endopeptidase